MIENVHETTRRWLDAERRATREAGGANLAAERALRELMLRLPDVRPRTGFAQRVVAAAGLELHGAATGRFLALPRWPLRALLAVCLLLTGSVVAWLPALARLVVERVTLADMISSLARTFTTMVDYMTVLIGAGKVLGALYDALLRVLTAPPVALAWLGAVVFSTLTLRWLVRTLEQGERSSEYVSAHG